MSCRRVEIVAPSRLHFGMFSFGHANVRRFGGVGAMLAEPALRLAICAADQFTTRGLAADRIVQVAHRVASALALQKLPACEIAIESGYVPHAGLGSGTQLAMSVGAGLYRFLDRPIPPAAELATIVGRGRRSAIGSYGFALGGLLLDAGKLADDEIAPLADRADVPAAWRFILVRPDAAEGLSGNQERLAFDRLPPVPTSTTDRLCRLATDELFPAARAADFDRFADAVHELNIVAGNCFAAIQGGPFNGSLIADLVARLQSLGAHGLGQSSWGPTLFAVAASPDAASELAERIRAMNDCLLVSVVRPANQGGRDQGH